MPNPTLPPAPIYLAIKAYGEMAFMTYAAVASAYRILDANLDPLPAAPSRSSLRAILLS